MTEFCLLVFKEKYTINIQKIILFGEVLLNSQP